MEYKSLSSNQTEQIASDIAAKFRGGEIITLDGDLGAGKTAFVRGLARGLGIDDRVVSPTFTIVNEYTHGRIPLFHFDVYRLGSADELYDIGWEDYLLRGGIIVVEWADIVSEIFSGEECIRVRISKDMSISEDYRIISVEGAEL